MKFVRDYLNGVVCHVADIRTNSGGGYCLIGFFSHIYGFQFNFWNRADVSNIEENDVPEELRSYVESEFFEIDVKRFIDRNYLKIIRWI